ncbi:uncharacterized protein [Panulirus ornatus]|uniref:uncharacterized protein n=1 Tax=Panulirus ornatus TaxID=150431 RepID=UPI003A843C79
MFYSYDILNPRKGKLAVVWLVATGRFKYSRRQDKNFRDVMRVKVHNTCDEILRYVHRGGNRVNERFSLYLSSMLMYGTVKVYRRQITFLLDEALETFEKLHRQCILMMELDAPVAGKARVTIDPMIEQVTAMEPTPIPGLQDTTVPRSELMIHLCKVAERGAKAKTTPPVAQTTLAEPEELRRRSAPETDMNILAMLEADWTEEVPMRARLQDITMRDEDLLLTSSRMFEEQQELLRSVGPLDLGPCFSTWEGPVALHPAGPDTEDIRRSAALDEAEVRDQDARRAEEPKRVEELEMTPLECLCLPFRSVLEVRRSSTVLSDADQQFGLSSPQLLHLSSCLKNSPSLRKRLHKRRFGRKSRYWLYTLHWRRPLPSEPQNLMPELPRKGSAPPTAEEQTPDVTTAAAPPATAPPSQMELQPLELGGPALTRRKRQRRLKIDQNIHISTEAIRAQTREWADTMRVRTASEDVIHVHWWRRMVPAQQLMHQATHRRPLAFPLTHLLTRHYRADPAQEHWDFRPYAKRQLQLGDKSREEARPGVSQLSMDVSSLTDASALLISHHEESRGSSSRSIHLTPKATQLEATVPPSIIQDPSQLLPIAEEQGLEMLPPPERERVSLAAPGLQEDQQQPEEQLTIPSEKTPVRPPRQGVKKPRLDEEIHLATPGEKVRRHERVSSYVPPDVTPPRGPPRSPVNGAVVVTVQAEVHERPQPISDVAGAMPPPAAPEEPSGALPAMPPPLGTQEFEFMTEMPSLAQETALRSIAMEGISMFEPPEETVAPEPVSMPGPHAPPGPVDTSEAFIPSFISPIKRTPPPSRRYQDTEKELSDLISMTKRTAFADLLPQNPTRLEVAHMFSVLLEMHKKRIIHLEQEKSFATIYVTWL